VVLVVGTGVNVCEIVVVVAVVMLLIVVLIGMVVVVEGSVVGMEVSHALSSVYREKLVTFNVTAKSAAFVCTTQTITETSIATHEDVSIHLFLQSSSVVN